MIVFFFFFAKYCFYLLQSHWSFGQSVPLSAFHMLIKNLEIWTLELLWQIMCKCSPLRTYVPLDDRRVMGQFSWRNRNDQQTPGWALPADSPTKWTSAPFLPAAAAAKLLQLCPTLCDPIDGSPPGSSVSGILQARILEWVAISFSPGEQLCEDSSWFSCWHTLIGPRAGGTHI